MLCVVSDFVVVGSLNLGLHIFMVASSFFSLMPTVPVLSLLSQVSVNTHRFKRTQWRLEVFGNARRGAGRHLLHLTSRLRSDVGAGLRRALQQDDRQQRHV
jgi:hypothetical protein